MRFYSTLQNEKSKRDIGSNKYLSQKIEVNTVDRYQLNITDIDGTMYEIELIDLKTGDKLIDVIDK